ncbi:MAG: HypC/HybG/HupF family hydrogenase formation chaperone [Bacteroidales bacterium]|nr:HypC/HybG/HupF family hydrogenase formation chaperone [Bacteroidales bacterium]
MTEESRWDNWPLQPKGGTAMCLSIPAKIENIHGDEATVSVNGALYKAGIQMIKDAMEGEYVLLHAGFAIQKIDEKEARETLELYNEMYNLNNRNP